MTISEYPDYLYMNGFKKKYLSDRSGSWFEKKVYSRGIGYAITVDIEWKIICVSLDHKVKKGHMLVDELKEWKLNEKNLMRVLEEWDTY